MARHVAEHLLKDAEHRNGPALALRPGRGLHLGGHVKLDVGLDGAPIGELLRLPFERRPQALVVEDAGPQVGDDAAQGVDRRVDQPAHAREPR